MSNIPPDDVEDVQEDYFTEKYPLDNPVRYWMRTPIQKQHLVCVQNLCIVHGATKMVAQADLNLDKQLNAIHGGYREACQVLCDAGLVSIEDYNSLVARIFKGKKGAIDGPGLKNKYDTIKKTILNDIAPLFIKDICAIGSGKGLRNKFNRMILELYKKLNPVSLNNRKKHVYTCITYHYFPSSAAKPKRGRSRGSQFETPS